jgi:hypothetical protein
MLKKVKTLFLNRSALKSTSQLLLLTKGKLARPVATPLFSTQTLYIGWEDEIACPCLTEYLVEGEDAV